jgi:23S rRNA-/tRNA-specific pseudouridylate synthase
MHAFPNLISRCIPILYNSLNIIAIDKPPGLSVHAAPGPGSSILKELAKQFGAELTPIHRLDKDASGVLLLARNKAAAAEVQRNWQSAEKFYTVLCDGVFAAAQGIIDAPILEHQTGKPERLRNALRYFTAQNPSAVLPPLPPPKTSAVHPAGRTSQTEYAVLEQFQNFALLVVRPKQGRMHQIRVHLTHLNHPLAIDPLYGKRAVLLERDINGKGGAILLERLPLHASKLIFMHQNQSVTIEAPLPADFSATLSFLRNSAGNLSDNN